jgi:hypothetical protein
MIYLFYYKDEKLNTYILQEWTIYRENDSELTMVSKSSCCLRISL